MDEKRKTLRESLSYQEICLLLDQQQLAKARASRFIKVINPAMQILLTVQREIHALLKD